MNRQKPHLVSMFRGRSVLKLSMGWAHTVAVVSPIISPESVPAIQEISFFSKKGWFTVGDIDGLFAQLLSAVIQMMLLSTLLV